MAWPELYANKTLQDLTPAQWRCHERAHFTPDRIVIGQVCGTMQTASILIAVGLWEEAGMFPYRRGPVHLFRLTDLGRKVKCASDLEATL